MVRDLFLLERGIYHGIYNFYFNNKLFFMGFLYLFTIEWE